MVISAQLLTVMLGTDVYSLLKNLASWVSSLSICEEGHHSHTMIAKIKNLLSLPSYNE